VRGCRCVQQKLPYKSRQPERLVHHAPNIRQFFPMLYPAFIPYAVSSIHTWRSTPNWETEQAGSRYLISFASRFLKDLPLTAVVCCMYFRRAGVHGKAGARTVRRQEHCCLAQVGIRKIGFYTTPRHMTPLWFFFDWRVMRKAGGRALQYLMAELGRLGRLFCLGPFV